MCEVILILVILALVCAFLVIPACMLSSRISRRNGE